MLPTRAPLPPCSRGKPRGHSTQQQASPFWKSTALCAAGTPLPWASSHFQLLGHSGRVGKWLVRAEQPVPRTEGRNSTPWASERTPPQLHTPWSYSDSALCIPFLLSPATHGTFIRFTMASELSPLQRSLGLP